MNFSLAGILAPGSWPGFACVLTRVTGLTMVAPLWSMNGVPRRIRVAVAIVLTLALLPAVPRPALPEALPVLPLTMAGELLIGLLIGLTAAVFVHGVALAGEVVATQMGLSMAPALNPMSDDLVPGIGQLKTLLAVMIYIALDGHLAMIRGLAESFRVLPPGVGFSLDAAPALAARFLGTVYSTALRAAAPAMVALFLVNLAVAITGRAVPQFPAMMVIFPITITAGFIMIILALPAISLTLARWMAEVPGRILEVLTALHAGT